MAGQKDYYINIRRSLFEHWLWEDKPFSRGAAWIDLIQRANTKYKKYPINGQIVHLKRGEFITSIAKLADKWGWTRNRVRRFLDLLECDSMVTRQSTNQFTLITLLNYKHLNKGQKVAGNGKRTANGQQTDSKRTANGQPADTINQLLINKEDKDQSSSNINLIYKDRKDDDDWFFIEFKKITGHAISKSEEPLLPEVLKNPKANIERALADMRKYKGRSIKYLLKVIESHNNGPVKKPALDTATLRYHFGCTHPDSGSKTGSVYRILKTDKYYCVSCGKTWPDKSSLEKEKKAWFRKNRGQTGV